MSLPLPGTPLPLVGYKLDQPYSVREDETKLYLCFGSEEVVAEFDHAVSVAAFEASLRIDRAPRAAHGIMPWRFGLLT